MCFVANMSMEMCTYIFAIKHSKYNWLPAFLVVWEENLNNKKKYKYNLLCTIYQLMW